MSNTCEHGIRDLRTNLPYCAQCDHGRSKSVAERDIARMDWLENHLQSLNHGRGTCSVDMGGKDLRGSFILPNQKQFRVHHRSIREAIDDAMKTDAK